MRKNVVLLICSVIFAQMVAAQSGVIQLSDEHLIGGSGDRHEAPVNIPIVTYTESTVNIKCDSLLYDAEVIFFNIDKNAIYHETIDIFPSGVNISFAHTDSICSVSVIVHDKRYIGFRSGFGLSNEPELASYLTSRYFPNRNMIYYVYDEYATGFHNEAFWEVIALDRESLHSNGKYTCYHFSWDMYKDVTYYENLGVGDLPNPDTLSIENDIPESHIRYISYSYGNNNSLKPYISENTTENREASHTYAIIFNGVSDKYHNYEENWNNCSFMYQTLVYKFHVPKSHVYVMSGSGTGQADMYKASKDGFIPTPLDIDDDGENEVLAATWDNYTDAIGSIQSSITDRDQLYVFFVGHSFSGRNDIETWDYNISAQMVNGDLNNMNAHAVHVFLGMDYAGQLSQFFKNGNKSVTTVCGSAEHAEFCSDKPYTDFAYRWLCGINKSEMHGTNQGGGGIVTPINPTSTDFPSDANHNGIITMSEAYNYAQTSMEADSNCDFWTSSSICSRMAMNYIPLVFPLYMCDNENDGGVETGSTDGSIYQGSGYYWNSPDIYLRNTNDGFSNQTHEALQIESSNDEAYVYVKVRNYVSDPYPGNNVHLHLFWYCSYLRGPIMYNPNDPVNYNLLYGKVGSVELSSMINGLSNQTTEFEWTIPQQLYQYCVVQGRNIPISFVAVLSNDEDLPCSVLNDVKYYYSKAQQLRTIAMKDINYVQVPNNQNSVTLMLGENDGVTGVNYEISAGCGDGYDETSEIQTSIISDGEHLVAGFNFENVTLGSTGRYLFHVVQKDSVTGQIVGGQAIEVERVQAVQNNESDSVNSFKSISYDGLSSSVDIVLNHPAGSETVVQLYTTDSTSSIQTVLIPVGQTEIQLHNIDTGCGMAIVSLLQEGVTVDTRKIMQ